MFLNINKPCNIYAKDLDKDVLDQFEKAMQQDCVVAGALMPDAHLGYTLPIGAVVAVRGVVFPSYIGWDIGCGVCALPTSYSVEEVTKNAQAIFDNIYKEIPVGYSHNKKESLWRNYDKIPSTNILKEIFEKNGLLQLGSLGGGNHFIEIGKDEDNKIWIVVHSGSRGIGHTIAGHYMKIASGDGKAREGHFGLLVDSQNGWDYIKDLNFCLEFALQNRLEIVRRVAGILSKYCFIGEGFWSDLINKNHNHAEYKNGLWVHRKGATQAEAGMLGVVPGNMRDGCFIVRGKGNPESLSSSSHGAGRVLGRKAAQKTLSVDDFQNSMAGITALVNEDTLDESPLAYKNIYAIMEQQKDLVEIIHHISPIINIKSGV